MPLPIVTRLYVCVSDPLERIANSRLRSPFHMASYIGAQEDLKAECSSVPHFDIALRILCPASFSQFPSKCPSRPLPRPFPAYRARSEPRPFRADLRAAACGGANVIKLCWRTPGRTAGRRAAARTFKACTATSGEEAQPKGPKGWRLSALPKRPTSGSRNRDTLNAEITKLIEKIHRDLGQEIERG